MISGKLDAFQDINGQLIGCYGGMLFEVVGKSFSRIGKFSTAPIYFDGPEIIKRFRRILLRTAVDNEHPHGYEVCAVNRTEYEYTLSKDEVKNTVYGADIEVEARYEHRQRARRYEIDLGFYDGYGGNMDLYAEGGI